MNQKRKGFTIIEATLSVAIVGILLATSLTTFAGIAKSRRVVAERRIAYALGRQLMTEIQQQYFQDPTGATTLGPDGAETRPTYNDVDDYNGFTETPPTNKSGKALSDYTGWTRSVVVNYVDPTAPTTTVASSTLKQIIVTVTAPGGKKYTLTALRSQYGPYEPTPLSQTNYLTWVGMDLQTMLRQRMSEPVRVP